MSPQTPIQCAAAIAAALVVHVIVLAGAPAARQDASSRTVEVVARRYAFEPSVIEVQEGETIRILVRSADGVHGFGIKKLKVAERVPRGGEPISVEFTATAVGDYEIVCSEYCGKGHEEMRARLIVRAREGRTR